MYFCSLLAVCRQCVGHKIHFICMLVYQLIQHSTSPLGFFPFELNKNTQNNYNNKKTTKHKNT